MVKNKYLEALHTIAFNTQINGMNFGDELRTIEKALQRLEAIDNAKPSEAFECLRQIGIIEMYYHDGTLLKDSISFKPEYDTIKNYIIKAYEDGEENERLWNDITTVDKQYTDLMLDYQEQRKVLEIIFEKNVDIIRIRHLIFKSQKNPKYWDLRYYNEARVIDDEKLTQEEFELLKRYFK